MHSIDALKVKLAVDHVVVEEQKRRVLEDSKSILYGYELGNDLGIYLEQNKDRLMNTSSVEAFKEAICAVTEEFYGAKFAELEAAREAGTIEEQSRYSLIAIEEILADFQSLKDQIAAVEVPAKDSIVDKVAKIDDRYWVLICNGQEFLYDTTSIGAGENGSVHKARDSSKQEDAERVIKLQYGRMDVTEFTKIEDGVTIDGQKGYIAIANEQRYFINKEGYSHVLEIGDDEQLHLGPAETQPVREINDRFYFMEFIAQSGGVVKQEHTRSTKYKPGNKSLGVEKAEVDLAGNREFLEHVVPVVEHPGDKASDEELQEYEVKLVARKLLIANAVNSPVFALVQRFVDGESLDRLINPAKKLLVIDEGTPATKSKTALDFVLALIKATSSLHSKDNGGDYDDGTVKGIYHRDIRPGNIKRKADGSIEFIDLGAAIEYGEDGVAKAKMGQTPKYSHPDIIAAVTANRGMEVMFEYKEKHEAYSMLRVIEDYLQSFIQQNPETQTILNAIIEDLNREWESFADMRAFVEQQMRPAESASAARIPINKRPILGAKPVSAKLAAIIKKLTGDDKDLSSSINKTPVTFANPTHFESLKQKFEKEGNRAVSPDLSKPKGRGKGPGNSGNNDVA